MFFLLLNQTRKGYYTLQKINHNKTGERIATKGYDYVHTVSFGPVHSKIFLNNQYNTELLSIFFFSYLSCKALSWNTLRQLFAENVFLCTTSKTVFAFVYIVNLTRHNKSRWDGQIGSLLVTIPLDTAVIFRIKIFSSQCIGFCPYTHKWALVLHVEWMPLRLLAWVIVKVPGGHWDCAKRYQSFQALLLWQGSPY